VVCCTLEPDSDRGSPVRRAINTPNYITPVDDDATEPESDGEADRPQSKRKTNPSASFPRRLSPALGCSETEPETDSDGDGPPSQADESQERVHARDDEDKNEDNYFDEEIEYCPVRICAPRSSLVPSLLLSSTTARNLHFQLLQLRHYADLWCLTPPKVFKSRAPLIATCASTSGRGFVFFGIVMRRVGAVSWETIWVSVCLHLHLHLHLDSRF
jgi:hypothetical protein